MPGQQLTCAEAYAPTPAAGPQLLRARAVRQQLLGPCVLRQGRSFQFSAANLGRTAWSRVALHHLVACFMLRTEWVIQD